MRRLAPLLLVLVTAPAFAFPPNAWDRARVPELAREEDLVEAARVMLTEADAARRDRALSTRLAGHAKSILENLRARESLDPRRRFLLGAALAMLDEDGEVVKVLGPALELAPEHPMAPVAAFQVAIAFARAGKAEEEIEAWSRYLDLQPAQSGRHIALYNRAEARLRLGDLEGAERDYRASLKVQDDPLGRYGLAITLDRSGRFSDAANESRKAASGDRTPTRLSSDGVFFVPEYEKHWYLALNQLGLAGLDAEAGDHETRAMHLTVAARQMETWLAKAPSSDPWVGLAKSRKKLLDAMAKTAADLAKKKAKEAPPPPPVRPPLRPPIR